MIAEWPPAEGFAPLPGSAQPGSTYRIVLRNLVLDCSIGTYAHEKQALQRVRISAELLVGAAPEPGRDELRNVLNYEPLVAGIKAIAAAGHIHLVETLAERIIEFCLGDPRLAAARLTVEKLDVYPEAESVGIVLERWRARVPDKS